MSQTETAKAETTVAAKALEFKKTVLLIQAILGLIGAAYFAAIGTVVAYYSMSTYALAIVGVTCFVLLMAIFSIVLFINAIVRFTVYAVIRYRECLTK